MFDFLKNFLRGTNSTEVERQLAQKDGPVTWGNPYVEVYEADRAVTKNGSYVTNDGITITYEGEKLMPQSQFIVLTQGEEVLRYKGYFGSENVGLALLKWRSA